MITLLTPTQSPQEPSLQSAKTRKSAACKSSTNQWTMNQSIKLEMHKHSQVHATGSYLKEINQRRKRQVYSLCQESWEVRWRISRESRQEEVPKGNQWKTKCQHRKTTKLAARESRNRRMSMEVVHCQGLWSQLYWLSKTREGGKYNLLKILQTLVRSIQNWTRPLQASSLTILKQRRNNHSRSNDSANLWPKDQKKAQFTVPLTST